MADRYQVSKEFKENCKSNTGLNRYGRIHVIEDDIDIVGEDYNGQLVDFKIEDNCYVNDRFVGTTVAKKITVNILNPNNSINLENKTIQVYVGIYINGELEEIPYGTYIIEKPDNEEVKQKTSFTGYDYMIKFNDLYKDRVKYPIKASELFKDICEQLGLEIGNVNFTNADYMILGNPFTNNEDYKTVLSNIAQLAGGFAKIGRDNKVYIVSLKNISNLLTVKYVNAMTVKELNLTEVKVLSGEGDNADETLDGNNYFEDFSKNEQWGGLNSLVLSITDIEGENTALDDKADIEENGLTEITIKDNYFLIDKAEREKVIVPLWNNLKGLKYLPFKTKYYGYPYLDTGDMIYIQDTKDNGYISYVFNHTFTFNGSFEGTLETLAMTKTQTAYKNTFDLKTKFKNAERSIDKINGIIRDVVQEQSETSNKLSEHEQTIDSIKDAIEQIEDYTKEIEENDQMHLTKTPSGEGYVINFKIKGNTDKFIYLAPSPTLVPSETLVPLGEHFTLICDKQNRAAISEEAIEIDIKLPEPLRDLNGTYDELNIVDGKTTVTRRIGVDEDLNLYILSEPIIEQLQDIILKTFDESTYIYIKEYRNLNYSAKYIIKSDYSDNFITKVEANSKIEQNSDKILSQVNVSLEDLNKTLSATLELKVNKNDLISEINASADIIRMTAGKFIFTGDNFSINEDGEITATGGKIGGFNISSSYLANNTTSLAGASNSVYLGTNGMSCGTAFKVTNTGQLTCTNANITGTITATKGTIAGFTIGENLLSTDMYGFNSKGDVLMWIGSSNPSSAFFCVNRYGWTQCNTANKNATEDQVCGSAYNWAEYYTDIKPHIIKIGDTKSTYPKNETILTKDYITTPELEQTSLEEIKKNITLFNKSATEIIKNSDIYEYNFKTEKDTHKKHIGFVIGSKYRTPDEVISEDGKGIEAYSQRSVLWKAVQEVIERIEKLEGEK